MSGPSPVASGSTKARARRGSSRRDRGFSILEAMTLVVIMGTAVHVALPAVQRAFLAARAGDVVADFETVRDALTRYRAANAAWPGDGYPGEVPFDLIAHLPEGFDFEGAGYRLDWQHWLLPNGLPGSSGTRVVAAVTVVTPDRALGRAVMDLLDPGLPRYELRDTYTFVIARE